MLGIRYRDVDGKVRLVEHLSLPDLKVLLSCEWVKGDEAEGGPDQRAVHEAITARFIKERGG